MSIGLALGSGGARGWCHIGVLRELERMDITPCGVSGCSMGALVGACWAAGKLDALEDWARSLDNMKFMGLIDVRLQGGGVVQGQAVRDILRDIGLPERIEDLEKPFLAVATDLSSGREVWFRDGSLVEAIRASISIPGVFSPSAVNDRWMLDGGW